MKKLSAVIFFIAVLRFTNGAGAVPWTWTDSLDPADVYLSLGSTYSYKHDIKNEGFNVGSDIVSNFDLRIGLRDDSSDPFWGPLEAAFISIPGILGDSLPVSFSIDDAVLHGSILGWVQLNATGVLDVSVTSVLGDFFFTGSVLEAHGNETAPVPVPPTFLVMGTGILMFLIFRRKIMAG